MKTKIPALLKLGSVDQFDLHVGTYCHKNIVQVMECLGPFNHNVSFLIHVCV